MHLNKEIKTIIKNSLKEDAAKRDITTLFTIPRGIKAKVAIVSRECGVLCGIDIAKEVFSLGPSLGGGRGRSIFKIFKKDGVAFRKNEKIAIIEGDARTILTCERIALNFLSQLSGIATLSQKFVEKVKGTGVKIMDTRKTTPNLRILEKYAVRVGGGRSHRKSLEEAILIKDNHLRIGKFMYSVRESNGVSRKKIDEEEIRKLIYNLRKKTSSRVEVEVENLKEFKGIIKYKPDIIMLDNFAISALREAVVFRNRFYPEIKLEASGRIRLNSVRRVAKCGVDFISAGTITHSPKAIDFSLETL